MLTTNPRHYINGQTLENSSDNEHSHSNDRFENFMKNSDHNYDQSFSNTSCKRGRLDDDSSHNGQHGRSSSQNNVQNNGQNNGRNNGHNNNGDRVGFDSEKNINKKDRAPTELPYMGHINDGRTPLIQNNNKNYSNFDLIHNENVNVNLENVNHHTMNLDLSYLNPHPQGGSRSNNAEMVVLPHSQSHEGMCFQIFFNHCICCLMIRRFLHFHQTAQFAGIIIITFTNSIIV
jgi:hypothetical protein